MKRAGILGLAVVLLLGLAAVTEARKAKKVTTEAEVEGFRSFPSEIEFFGDVHSRKSKCEKNREVTLVYRGPIKLTDPVIGTDTTDETGDWEYRTNQVLPEGDYAVEVDRKKTGKPGKKVVCKAATSPDKLLTD
jgi:hypothetical protein